LRLLLVEIEWFDCEDPNLQPGHQERRRRIDLDREIVDLVERRELRRFVRYRNAKR
jgi:hypothetical protein